MKANQLVQLNFKKSSYTAIMCPVQHLCARYAKPCPHFDIRSVVDNLLMHSLPDMILIMYFTWPCFLNQVHASHRQVRAWFLKIDPLQNIGMRVYVCVCPHPRLLLTSGVMWCDMDLSYYWLNKFYSCYMATIAIIVDGRSLGIDMHHGN